MSIAVDQFVATDQWLRNESDAKAAHAGYRFNVTRGAFVVWWIERYCTLYEGDYAGQPLRLCGSASVDADFPPDRTGIWDDEAIEIANARAEAYSEEFAAGRHVDWQYECTMRMFGWERYSERKQRWLRRFRVASIWVPKKNKKSPTLPGWGFYLLIGDGEPGQKVFYAAKDGTQARGIVGEHAVAMLEQSEELQRDSDEQPVCILNKNLMRITHLPSRSFMQPLSSSNERTQAAKEGLNGSLLVDETHVVDKAFMGRIKRAGISRSEPFQIEASTSGDDPECYGKEQHDKGKLVESGARTDHRFFFAYYGVPEKLTDAELGVDPLNYGRMANPAWEHTIDPDEFLADYIQSKAGSKRDFAEFWMYRLNRWQQGYAPWLRLEDWQKGKREFTIADMQGRECWSALDFGRTRDMTALCLAFREKDDAIRLLWWFWVPEQYARDNADKAPFLDFAADPRCNLTLVPGEVLDISYVVATCRELHEQVKVQELAYDNWNAEEATKQISEGITNEKGKVVVKGLGWERHAFSQGIRQFNEATKEFERRVITGDIQHNGDPCMEWQARHVTVREYDGNLKPMKPKKDSVQKVDGMITGVMAMHRAIAAPRPKRLSVYAHRGLVTT